MRVWIVLMCVAAGLSAESVAGLKWTGPAGWMNKGSQPMRAATYEIPAAAGDKEAAECAVYFFGQGQGGSVEANLDRWKGQVKGPAKVSKRTVHGLAVTTLDASGDYSGMGGPMATTSTVKSGYRLLGAIIEGPGGSIFIKFAGPSKTVAQNIPKYEQMLASFDKDH